jgi:predicted transcriptional regulator
MNANKKIQSAISPDLQLAFDVGHSSIGWAVLQSVGRPPAGTKLTSEVRSPRAETSINILGCGSVVFRADDCLASSRRAYRRQRRHIRSTRQRIARMKIILEHLGVLSKSELNRNDCAWPWLLAARVLRGGKLLTWPELWHVLRWYAHNRGYDGNLRWSKTTDAENGTPALDEAALEKVLNDASATEDEKDDVKKVKEAKSLMQKHGVHSMAETFCKELGVDPLGKKKSSTKRFKGLNAAFPREVVEGEVRKILQTHSGKLKSLDANLERALIGKNNQDKLAWQTILCPSLKLPKRYEGGLLFGLLIPRFHNRIISICPITFAQKYQQLIAEGKAHDEAKHKAEIAAKVPTKKCREFLEFRWAMLLADLTVKSKINNALRNLSGDERNRIHGEIKQRGFFTKDELEKSLRDATPGFEPANLDAMFKITSEREDSLVLDPVKKFVSTNEIASAIWPTLPAQLQKHLENRLRRGKSIKLSQVRTRLIIPPYNSPAEKFDSTIVRLVDSENLKNSRKKRRKKDADTEKKKVPLTVQDFLKRQLEVRFPTGRARYHRNVLKQAVAEILRGEDPRKKCQDDILNGMRKQNDGCLVETEEMQRLYLGQTESAEDSEKGYRAWLPKWLKKKSKTGKMVNQARYDKYGDPYARAVYEARLSSQWLAAQTNNHLVRHRLLILDRLTTDIIHDKNFADGKPERIGKVSIEVANDILAMSGMSSVEKAKAKKSMSNQHEAVKKFVMDQLKEEGLEHCLNGNLLWKAKVADDLKWKCPYTLECISVPDLVFGRMDVDHIIPKSKKLTNAMQAVVITFKQVNAMKGARTSWQFVEELNGKSEAERTIPGTNKAIKSLDTYKAFVASLKTWGEEPESRVKYWPKYLDETGTKEHPDYLRRKKRVGFLETKQCDKNNDSFAPRDLTVTSHINRLAQQVLLKRLSHLGPENISAIPGTVTGTIRDMRGWKLLGCLGDKNVCGRDVMTERPVYDWGTRKKKIDEKTGEVVMKSVPLPKGEIRKKTYLHHALDACVLGLLSHLLPKDGKLWELFALKELTDSEKELFERLSEEFRWKGYRFGDFFETAKIGDSEIKESPDPDRKWRIVASRDAKDRLHEIKDQIIRCLSEKRVVRHIPADMSGLPADETVWRVVDLSNRDELKQIIRQKFGRAGKNHVDKLADGLLTTLNQEKENGQVWLVRSIRRDSTPKPDKPKKLLLTTATFYIAYDQVRPDMLIGVKPEGEPEEAKLYRIKGAKQLNANYGLAIINGEKPDVSYQVIPWFKVGRNLRKLRETNSGKSVEILKRGQLIQATVLQFEGRGRPKKDAKPSEYPGIWRVDSIKAPATGEIELDLTTADGLDYAFTNRSLQRELKDIKPLKTPLTGIAACPAPPSA